MKAFRICLLMIVVLLAYPVYRICVFTGIIPTRGVDFFDDWDKPCGAVTLLVGDRESVPSKRNIVDLGPLPDAAGEVLDDFVKNAKNRGGGPYAFAFMFLKYRGKTIGVSYMGGESIRGLEVGSEDASKQSFLSGHRMLLCETSESLSHLRRMVEESMWKNGIPIGKKCIVGNGTNKLHGVIRYQHTETAPNGTTRKRYSVKCRDGQHDRLVDVLANEIILCE